MWKSPVYYILLLISKTSLLSNIYCQFELANFTVLLNVDHDKRRSLRSLRSFLRMQFLPWIILSCSYFIYYIFSVNKVLYTVIFKITWKRIASWFSFSYYCCNKLANALFWGQQYHPILWFIPTSTPPFSRVLIFFSRSTILPWTASARVYFSASSLFELWRFF